MIAGVQVAITLGTGRFDPEDRRWTDQVEVLAEDLRENVGRVSIERIPVPGSKGAISDVILALGSAGALTAAVDCFRAWLGRDKTRTLTVRWREDEREQTVTVNGHNLDQESFRTLADAIGKKLNS